MSNKMANKMTMSCEVCGKALPTTNCIRIEDSYYCSKDCSFISQSREEMSLRRKSKKGVEAFGKKWAVFDWGAYLDKTNSEAAPTHAFKHAWAPEWAELEIGMYAEVPVPKPDWDCQWQRSADEPLYWMCTMVKFAGFKVKLRYLAASANGSSDFWFSLTSPDIHSISWCAHNNRQLIPPLSIKPEREDWIGYIKKHVIRRMTLLDDFHTMFRERVGSHAFRKGMLLEVVDKICIAAMRVARVADVVDDRLHIAYEKGGDEVVGDGGNFWCSKDSSIIHPVGWSSRVGHRLHASSEYLATIHERSQSTPNTRYPDDCTPDMFDDPNEKPLPLNFGEGFKVGMKLEAVDPVNLSSIQVASVVKVLKDNYLMIGSDGYTDRQNEEYLFCYHATSASILPAGFCERNGIKITPPRGYERNFTWSEYLSTTRSLPAPPRLFSTKAPTHSFSEGMKLEAVDLIDPRFICVATVAQVAGRLLRIHFDGWEANYDQWIDCDSTDIYPVGWCEEMKFELKPPPKRRTTL